MSTLRKITIGLAIIAVLIVIFILLLKLRSFTKKELEAYIVKKETFITQEAPSQKTQQAILPVDTSIDVPQYPFPVGEKLKYFIYSAAIKVGEVDISYLGRREIKGMQRDVILLEAKAPGFTDRDTIYGDIKTFSPVRVERKIALFGENMDIIEEYDEDGQEVLITKVARKTTIQRIATSGKISNVILLLYHIRCNNSKYGIGKRFEFNLPTQKLEMLVEKRANIKVPKGEFSAVFVKSMPSRYKVWFKEDDGLPLRIQGAIGFGNTYLDLKGIE